MNDHFFLVTYALTIHTYSAHERIYGYFCMFFFVCNKNVIREILLIMKYIFIGAYCTVQQSRAPASLLLSSMALSKKMMHDEVLGIFLKLLTVG